MKPLGVQSIRTTRIGQAVLFWQRNEVPLAATLIYSFTLAMPQAGGSSSVAERQLPKLNVAGSIPVSRSNAS